MRQIVSSLLTAGRIRVGPYASLDSWGLTGAFCVACPATGRGLRIIASRGEEWEAAGLPLPAWEHVSVSLDQPRKCPSWPEMLWVKDLFWEPGECVVQFHPPQEVKVNRHEGCLHLWRPLGAEIPLPPMTCV